MSLDHEENTEALGIEDLEDRKRTQQTETPKPGSGIVIN